MKIKKAEVGNRTVRKKSFIENIYHYRHAYILILPSLLAVTIFLYLPLMGVILAFKDYNIYDGLWGSDWVGLKNFITVFKQPAMMKAVGNTVWLSFAIIFGTLPFPILLAVMFNEIWNTRFKKVVQTISYLPHFLSWVSVVGLCYALLSTEGAINNLLIKVLGDDYVAKNFLMESKYFVPISYFTSLWKNLGWETVIYMASIAGIDGALYEAATMDGAGKLRQTWNITLPSIKQTIIVVLVMRLGSVFNANFEMVYGLQNVFTIDDTEIISTLIYRSGIQNGNYSVATAFGLLQGLITITLILAANALSKKIAEVSIW